MQQEHWQNHPYVETEQRPEYEEYDVEIQQAMRVTVKVRAKNPLSAARIVDDTSYELPDSGDWEHVCGEGYEYSVRRQATGEVVGPLTWVALYRGDAQDLT